MRDLPSRYTELLLDFGMEGKTLLKWCQNKAHAGYLLPKYLFVLGLKGTMSLVCLSFCEKPGIHAFMNISYNGRDF
jgi:hypothetical protein